MLTEPMIPGAIFFVTGIATFFLYERLVKRQYQVAREVWEADGRPPGFAWAPPGTSVMRSWTRGKAYFRWIAETPSWIREDDIARTLQRQLRVLWLTGCASWLWLMILMLVRPEVM
jgi:hypothetical protein